MVDKALVILRVPWARQAWGQHQVALSFGSLGLAAAEAAEPPPEAAIAVDQVRCTKGFKSPKPPFCPKDQASPAP